MDLAHRRACHAGEARVKKTQDHVEGLNIKKSSVLTRPYALCVLGKGHALPFGKNKSIRTKLILATFLLNFSLSNPPSNLPSLLLRTDRIRRISTLLRTDRIRRISTLLRTDRIRRISTLLRTDRIRRMVSTMEW
jgi:hypothetical protein